MAPESDAAALEESHSQDSQDVVVVESQPTKKRNTSRIIEQTWIGAVVGWSVLRLVIAWGAFGDYGANIWIFALVDVGTAWPYAKAVAAVCKIAASSDWSKLPVAVVVAVALFFTPYAYLWFAAGEMPSDLRIGMVICMTVLLLAATAGTIAKTRKLRQANQAAEAHDDVNPAPTEVLIDLTGESAVVEHRAV